MMITVSEAARRLEMSEQRVRQLISQGKLKAVRVGARVLTLSEAAVSAFVRPPMGRPKNKIKKVLR